MLKHWLEAVLSVMDGRSPWAPTL